MIEKFDYCSPSAMFKLYLQEHQQILLYHRTQNKITVNVNNIVFNVCTVLLYLILRPIIHNHFHSPIQLFSNELFVSRGI